MRRNILIIVLSLFSIVNILAIPAKKTPRTVIQSDGKSLTYILKGDENSHYQETTDGFRITKNDANDWVYLFQNDSDEWTVSTFLAHNPDERSTQEISFLNRINKTDYTKKNVVRKKTTSKVKQTIAGKRVKQLASTPTSAKILIILAQYTDVRFKISNPQQTVSAQLNTAGYTGNGATGSARDFYMENSNNTFIPQFDVVGPVTLSNTMKYYGENDAEDYDKRPGSMIAEAARLAANLADFSQYDLDGDGKVDNLIVIYAGYNEAEYGPENSIWPHAWNLTEAKEGSYESFSYPVTIDGVKIEDYACTSELSGDVGTNVAGIGTICHEFGHVLGLPDIYDTDYDDNGQAPGMGDWSTMDGGSYLNEGKTPPYFTAFEREILGWADITVLNNAGVYNLAHIKQGQAYRINSSVNNEYFLLENRQQTGWDKYLPGHGMLITHVDMTDFSRMDDNTLNNRANHECVDLKEANGAQRKGSGSEAYYISSESDPFPGAKNKTRFDDSSSPANSKLWNGSSLNKPVFNISEANGTITFTFIEEPRFATPIATTASNLSPTSFMANWNQVDDAQNYYIDVYTKTAGNQATVKNETFAGITKVNTTALTSTTFVQNGLNGWTGTNTFAGCSGTGNSNDIINGLKFGSSKTKSGNIIFPVSLSGNATIAISAKDWESNSAGEGGIYKVLHDPAGGTNFQTVGTSSALNYNFYGEKSFDITGGTNASKIKIEISGGRAFINKIVIISGTPEVKTYLPGYQNLNAGNTNAASVINLPNPDQLYYYVVRATDGNIVSNNSNEITVNLKDASTQSKLIDNLTLNIYKNGNTLYIESETTINNIEVFNSVGQLIKKQAGVKGTNTMQLSKNQIYIIKIDGKAVKILM